MARTPEGITARSVTVTGRFRPSTVADIDRMVKQDGLNSRAKLIEKLVVEEKKRRSQRGAT